MNLPAQNRKATYAAALALLMLALVWSYNWVVAKSVLQYMGAFDFAALRSSFGALLLLVLLPLSGRSLRPPPWRPTLWIGVFQTAGNIGFSQWALVAGGAGKTAVLVYTMPFWVILLAALFLNEKPRLSQYVTASIAAVGLLLVIQPWQLFWGEQEGNTLLSSLLAVASGAAWAAAAVVAKRAFRHQTVDLLSLVTWQMLIGAVVLSILAVATHRTPIIWSPPMLLMLAYNAVLATALGWFLWLFILRTFSATGAGISTLMIPVMSVFWAWWLQNERPDNAEGIGIGLILLALALIGVPKTWWPSFRKQGAGAGKQGGE